jgi:DNA-directed RNA polymerase subunit RPC12/RpoP
MDRFDKREQVVKKIFVSTCAKCQKAFVVSWELRHAGLKLICPHCGNRYLPEESAKIDERGQDAA